MSFVVVRKADAVRRAKTMRKKGKKGTNAARLCSWFVSSLTLKEFEDGDDNGY